MAGRTKSLQRSRKELEKRGYKTAIVERPWNPWSKVRQDFFGFADIVGIRDSEQGVFAVQACGDDAASHIRKLLEGFTTPVGKLFGPNPYLPTWLRSGNHFSIWSWRLRKHIGTKDTYQLRQIEFKIQGNKIVTEEIADAKAL